MGACSIAWFGAELSIKAALACAHAFLRNPLDVRYKGQPTCRNRMRKHGVHFQPPLPGALHVARTNAF